MASAHLFPPMLFPSFALHHLRLVRFKAAFQLSSTCTIVWFLLTSALPFGCLCLCWDPGATAPMYVDFVRSLRAGGWGL
ncbi:hypothetical protein OAO87_00060 [bacterium]|nr:hypothetical protein [bacterium]